MFFKRLLYYLNPLTLFKKGEKINGKNANIKLMHGINRISIFMFLICMIILIIKLIKG
jgi:hypothetical protein